LCNGYAGELTNVISFPNKPSMQVLPHHQKDSQNRANALKNRSMISGRMEFAGAVVNWQICKYPKDRTVPIWVF